MNQLIRTQAYGAVNFWKELYRKTKRQADILMKEIFK